jgi:hypothetical protein
MMSSKKPRFNLQLTINDLSNIPQISGSCYIEVTIKNSNSLIKPLRVQNKFLKIEDDIEDEAEELGKTFSSHEKHRATTSLLKGSTVFATTSKKKIHNFKCHFNFSLSCNLKFPYKKSQNLIGNKYLLLKVFYSHGSENVLIGKSEINLLEYLNFDKEVTSKYLLKDSKVNSILSLTIKLTQLPSNQDFHTQLQLNDNISNQTTLTSISKDFKQSNFNIPQFDRKNIFGGFSDALNDDSFDKNPTNDTLKNEYDKSESNPGVKKSNSQISHKDSKCSLKFTKQSSSIKNSDTTNSSSNFKSSTTNSNLTKTSNSNSDFNSDLLPTTSQAHTQPGVVMDPIVSGLYRKILESTWDPELLPLLDYTPEKCINDIFNNSDNPQGWCPNINQDNWDMNEDDDDDNGLKNLNGLIDERKLRPDLKSWTVEIN